MNLVLTEGINTMPMGWQLWVFWMMVVNTAAIAFLRSTEGRIALGVWILNGITMTLMAEYLGYVRLLGLSHVLWWTPLIVYLARRFKTVDSGTWLRRWLVVLLLTNTASLVVDYVDVARYIAGDRDDQRPAVEALEAPATQEDGESAGDDNTP